MKNNQDSKQTPRVQCEPPKGKTPKQTIKPVDVDRVSGLFSTVSLAPQALSHQELVKRRLKQGDSTKDIDATNGKTLPSAKK